MYTIHFIIIKPNSFRSEFGWLGIRYIIAELEKMPDIAISVSMISECEQDSIIKEIKRNPPNLIGMPAFQLNLVAIQNLTAAIKEIVPQTHITLGNIEATIHQEALFEYIPHVDSLVVGEGEYTFRDMVDCLKHNQSLRKCKGLIFRNNNGKIIRNEMRPLEKNIDNFAFPDRDILPPFSSGFKVYDVITSRGCSGYCTFCNNQNFRMQPGPYVRYRSIDNVLNEIEELKTRYKASFISISDDTFGEKNSKGENRLEQFAQGLELRNINIRFRIQMRAELIQESSAILLTRLKKLGLDSIFIGIESGNQKDLKLYGKTATLQDNMKALRLLNQLNIAYSIGFIMFNPYSDFERLYENLTFLDQSEVLITPYLLDHKLWLFNGTPIYNKVRRDGLLFDQAGVPLTNGFLYRFLDLRVYEAWKTLFSLDSYPISFLRIDHVLSFYRYMASEGSIFRRKDSIKHLGMCLESFRMASRQLTSYARKVLYCAQNGHQQITQVLHNETETIRHVLKQEWERVEEAYRKIDTTFLPGSQAQKKLLNL